jgi:hypothetical protein
MNWYHKFDIYHHLKVVRVSFFAMAVILVVSLIIQLATNSDFGGLPFLLFGIGILVAFSTLLVRVIVKWLLRLR